MNRTCGCWSCGRAACWMAKARRYTAEWSWWWGRWPRIRSRWGAAGWTGSSARPTHPWRTSPRLTHTYTHTCGKRQTVCLFVAESTAYTGYVNAMQKGIHISKPICKQANVESLHSEAWGCDWICLSLSVFLNHALTWCTILRLLWLIMLFYE